MAQLHLLKLCVGADRPEDVLDWRERTYGPDRREDRHVTRMWPRREAELLEGGSLYWVMGGLIQCRQRIIGLGEVIGEDGIRRCAIRMETEIIRTAPAPRRPFQGWRYLAAEDAPPDLSSGPAATDMPPAMAAELAAIGVV